MENMENIISNINSYFDYELKKIGFCWFATDKYSKAKQKQSVKLMKRRDRYLHTLEYKSKTKQAQKIIAQFNNN